MLPLFAFAAVCAAQSLSIPPVETTLDIQGQPVSVRIWGSISEGTHARVTVDLADFQAKLTPILAAELNRSDRCGERLDVQRATLAPPGILTAYVHVERYACVKAFGKEMVKRVAGGNGVVEVALTPLIAENRIALTAEVRRIDADGSLGDVLRSGSLGDSLRQKIATSIESAVQKAATFDRALPVHAITLQEAAFTDGGSGRLWLTVSILQHESIKE